MSELSDVNVSAIKRMAEMPGWSELVREMNLMIEDLRDMLEAGYGEDSPSTADLDRGRIDGIRTILAWPESIAEQATTAKNLPQDGNE